MAVILSGMDIPKCCGDCFFNRQGADTWKCTAAYPVRWKDFGSPLEKPDWCPLEEQKHGEWIEDEDGDGRHCSVCGEDFCYLVSDCEKYKFCPTCGAKLL